MNQICKQVNDAISCQSKVHWKQYFTMYNHLLLSVMWITQSDNLNLNYYK